MNARTKLTDAYGRCFMLVASHRVLCLDRDRASALLRDAIAEDSSVLTRFGETRCVDPHDPDALIEELARDLEGGDLVIIEDDEELIGAGFDLQTDPTDWDDLPSLSDLGGTVRDETLYSLELELVDHRGAPYAGFELTLHDKKGTRRRVKLDRRGCWRAEDLPGPGAVRLDMPAKLHPTEEQRNTPAVEGFSRASDDIWIVREPKQPITLPQLDRRYRLVVRGGRHGFSA